MGASTELGGLSGYLAKPSGSGPWPGLIVIQEWWGLDPQTKSIADRFAGVGYLAFAPDLYHGELAKLGDGQTATTLVQKYGPGATAERRSRLSHRHRSFSGDRRKSSLRRCVNSGIRREKRAGPLRIPAKLFRRH